METNAFLQRLSYNVIMMKTIDLVNGVAVSIIFGVVILLIGYCRFRKLNIK